jgi:hypothetical protein
MKLLSIDVGIKNLALCMFEKTDNDYKIIKWEVLNLADKEVFDCCKTNKGNKKCSSPAKYNKNGLFFCTKHAKKEDYQLPLKDLKPAVIKKASLQKLKNIINNYEIPVDGQQTKNNLVDAITSYYDKNYFTEIDKENASKLDLISISVNLKNKLNELLKDVDDIQDIIIENQISTIATRMKTLQGMIVQYFVMSDICVDNIEFVSARNKLKYILPDNNKEKTTYSSRKKIGILACLERITNDHRFNNQLDYFNTHKKKDDLADAFLQGIWYIENRQ